ncbi:MAG: hypothetical protein K0S33_3241 [Bacteroidetes bacterium]|jgi:hypothetical protein|nr:hypothetical protein [Bacteroidota bacterium]
MNYFRILFLLTICYAFSSGTPKGISMEKKKTPNGNSYTIIYQNTCSIEFTDQRPKEKDAAVQLCIAGAFTQLTDYKIDGIYMCNGKIGNKTAVNKRLGGAIKIVKGQAVIFPTQKGTLLTDSFLNDLSTQKGSLFQQLQIVANGAAASFVDKAVFQRRAIVIFKNSKTALVEGNESITLAEFSKDLVELGAKDALYTDMGGWDEGWYTDPATGKKITIGQMRTSTAKQSNWVVFRK